jgi:hypothetical protein
MTCVISPGSTRQVYLAADDTGRRDLGIAVTKVCVFAGLMAASALGEILVPRGPGSTTTTGHGIPEGSAHLALLGRNAVTAKIPERPDPSRLPQRGGVSAERVADLELVAAHARVVEFQWLAGRTAG